MHLPDPAGAPLEPRVRDDFPLLRRRLDGRAVVYLDSAATSLKPQAVLDAERAYSTDFTANVHRGKHALSDEASAAYEAARRRVARLLSADPGCVVFLRNTTEALNLVASGLELSREDVVLTTPWEHHSNLVPWMRRAKVELLEGDPLEPISLQLLADALDRHRPRVLALGLASHVTGVIHPVARAAALARERGVLTVVDAAQAAPHLALDVEALGCDFLAFSGHKMLAPTGVGVLWGRAEVLDRLQPSLWGGGMVDRVTRHGFTLKRLPYRLEAGTPNISGALGLAAAVDYLEALGFDSLGAHERALALVLEQQLRDLPAVRVLMARAGPRLAIGSVAPLSNEVSADHLARLLSDSHQVMVRSGHHCAHPLFDALGLPHGALRVSAYLYNTADEIRLFGRALRAILDRLVVGR